MQVLSRVPNRRGKMASCSFSCQQAKSVRSCANRVGHELVIPATQATSTGHFRATRFEVPQQRPRFWKNWLPILHRVIER